MISVTEVLEIDVDDIPKVNFGTDLRDERVFIIDDINYIRRTVLNQAKKLATKSGFNRYIVQAANFKGMTKPNFYVIMRGSSMDLVPGGIGINVAEVNIICEDESLVAMRCYFDFGYDIDPFTGKRMKNYLDDGDNQEQMVKKVLDMFYLCRECCWYRRKHFLQLHISLKNDVLTEIIFTYKRKMEPKLSSVMQVFTNQDLVRFIMAFI